MVYFPVLAGEIAKRGIKKNAIAKYLGISDKTLSNKLSGRVAFTLPEVEKIASQFFPDMEWSVLFSHADRPTPEDRPSA